MGRSTRSGAVAGLVETELAAGELDLGGRGVVGHAQVAGAAGALAEIDEGLAGDGGDGFEGALDGEQAAFVGRAQSDLLLDTLDGGLDLGVVVEVELGDGLDQAFEAHDVAAVEFAVGLERGEHVGAGVVDEGVELALDVATGSRR